MAITTFPINTVAPTAGIIASSPAGAVTAADVQTAINQLAGLTGGLRSDVTVLQGEVGGGGGTFINPMNYGAFANSTSNPHLITATDITNNPQWIGLYDTTYSWDTVAVQEAIYAAFAPGSTHGTVVWNATTGDFDLNLPLYIPDGLYYINKQLLLVATGFTIEFASRSPNCGLLWFGDRNTTMLKCNSASYGVFIRPCLKAQVLTDVPLWTLDWSAGPSLKTQQLTIYDPIIEGSSLALQGLAISPSGNAAQGDTITIINPYVANFLEYGIQCSGTNALGIQIIGGDFQHCSMDGFSCLSGQIYIDKTSFQNQFVAGRSGYPVQNQIVNAGGDLHVYNNTTGNQSSLRDGRSESMTLVRCEAGMRTYVDNSSVFAAEVQGWSNGIPFPTGNLVSGGSKSKVFISVGDTGTNGYLPMGPASTTTVISDPAASYLTNQWVGFPLYIRFGSNGFITYQPIVSNTATTITVSPAFSSIPAPGAGGMYAVGGFTGGVVPAFDGLADGFSHQGQAVGQGFTTTVNSTTITYASEIALNIAANQWVVIPRADFVGPSLTGVRNYRCALFAKVVSTGGSSAVLSRPARFSMTDASGYYGAVITDNQAIWMQLDYDAYQGCSELHACYMNRGKLRDCGDLSQFYAGGQRDYLRSFIGTPFAVDYANGNIQILINNQATTITAPTTGARTANGQCLLQIKNGPSAGAITFSGFTVAAAHGDTITTVNGAIFTIRIWTINDVSSYFVTAEQ